MADVFTKPGIPTPAWGDDPYFHINTIIQAEDNTTVNEQVVPELTDDQILEAYNSVVAGKHTVVADKDGVMHFVVIEADSVSDDIYISILYFDTMILTYAEDGTITYKEL